MNNKIETISNLFEGKEIRSVWDTEKKDYIMVSPKDGKSYVTDVLDTKGILRLIESVPSPKAEVFCTK